MTSVHRVIFLWSWSEGDCDWWDRHSTWDKEKCVQNVDEKTWREEVTSKLAVDVDQRKLSKQ